jgi:hypothetical protein
MFRFLSATVGFDVSDPGVLRHVLLFLSHVEQQIETGKIRVAVDNGLNLLVLNSVHLANRFEEGVN